MKEQDIKISFTNGSIGNLSGILTEPPSAYALIIMAHGAGAGIKNRFMAAVAALLYERNLAVLRFNFPYMEAGKHRPESPARAISAWRQTIEFQSQITTLPIFIGGKSYGGRMASWVISESADLPVEGLIYWGFPLHAPGRPSNDRADHLKTIRKPMLFLQGTRDALADLNLLNPLIPEIPKAEIHIQEGADHSFHVLKSSGRSDPEVLAEISDKVVEWTKLILEE